MSVEESLQDVAIRERQLEAHILRSKEYLKRANQNIKRQIFILYAAIALLLAYQGFFTLRAVGWIAFDDVLLTTITSCVAIVTCLLLIRTKTWLRRLNEAWLGPQEKDALEALKLQRHEILTRLPRSRDGSENAELN